MFFGEIIKFQVTFSQFFNFVFCSISFIIIEKNYEVKLTTTKQ